MATQEQIKKQVMARVRARAGEDYATANAAFLEAQWEYLVQLGMIDPETDSDIRPETD